MAGLLLKAPVPVPGGVLLLFRLSTVLSNSLSLHLFPPQYSDRPFHHCQVASQRQSPVEPARRPFTGGRLAGHLARGVEPSGDSILPALRRLQPYRGNEFPAGHVASMMPYFNLL